MPPFSGLKSKPKKRSARSKKQVKRVAHRKLGLKRCPERVNAANASYSFVSHFHFYQST
jgi:hypothetical protein